MLDLTGERWRRVALIGGTYSNWLGLDAVVADARSRGVDAIGFLGDAGGFGPHPDRTVERLRTVPFAIQGNYDDSVGHARPDCACGYTDPRDDHFARISYEYTLANTSLEHRRWLAGLPAHARLRVGDATVLLCHGSPRRVNEFLWESTTPASFAERLCTENGVDLVACTHTGLHWERRLPDGRGVINVGAVGRPANDGRTEIAYTLLEWAGDRVVTTFVRVAYDWRRLCDEMRQEGLPGEFVDTIATGWWTTCLEILPARERSRGRF